MVNFRVSDEIEGGQRTTSRAQLLRMTSDTWSTASMMQMQHNSLDIVNEEDSVNPSIDELQRGPWFAAWCRETRIFVGLTAMHGVRRVWESREWSKLFWGLTVVVLFGILVQQMTLIVLVYSQKHVVSEINFVMKEEGLPFPKITICSYNPVRKSYVDKINKTGDFSMRLARYMMLANNDVLTIFGGNDEHTLAADEAELKAYEKDHTGFTINSFYRAAGFECEEVLKMCSFAGRQFNCCDYATAVPSELGLCQVINLQASAFAWMRKQTEATESAGLEIVLDAHLEELLDVSLSTDKVFNTQFENGFKFFLEDPDTDAAASSQGITVSPGDIIYTAIAMTTHQLLDKNNWGSCINEWPEGYNNTNGEKYQSSDCQSECKAKYFFDRCKCSPFMYNIEEGYRSCTPVEVYRCVRDHIVVDYNQTTEDYVFPECRECVTECNRSQFNTYNSYGRGFTDDAINALVRYNPEWTPEHIKQSFLSMNVFFREMAYTSYVQVPDTTITDTLSNMGGTMGLFLGMSVLTVIESIIYLIKIHKVSTRDVLQSLRSFSVDQSEAVRRTKSCGSESPRVIELRISVDELRRQLAMSGDGTIPAQLIIRTS